MRKFIYQAASFGIVCMAIGQLTIAQTAVPPKPPDTKKEIIEKVDLTEIVIRQKGDKDAKLTLEIKNGNYFINGKPLEKYDDQNIIVEKREVGADIIEIPEMAFSPSPFREREWDDETRGYRNEDMERQLYGRDMQRRIEKSIHIGMNAAYLGVSSRKSEKGGATVLEITKGSPAEKAGIKKGDIIIKVNEAKIVSPDGLYETIHNFKPGDKVKILFIRDGKEQSLMVTLEKSEQTSQDFNYNYKFKMPPMPPDMGGMNMGPWGPRSPKLGIKAQDTEDGKGVNILEVEDSSVAAKSGLKKGDIILQMDGIDVNSTNELVDQLQESQKKSIIRVKILRGGITQEIEVKIPRKLKTAEL